MTQPIPAKETIMPEPMRNIPALLAAELERQQRTINLIASENYAVADVRLPMSSIASSKYAEGYPGRRYYAGCEVIDDIEREAQRALLALFVHGEYEGHYVANVQPHAGSQANFGVYNALLTPGDTILGMSLSNGGHLTHGHAVNISGTLYNAISYGVDATSGLIDYDEVARRAREHKPKLIIAGASAYARTIDFARFAQIAKEVGALLLADIAHISGLVATGLHPSPVGHADIITSTTHKTLRGPRGAFIICRSELAKKIDMSIMPGCQGGPFMHAIAARAVAFQQAGTPEFKEYMAQVLACSAALAQHMSDRGYHIVSGGTDTHLFLIDLSQSTAVEMSGKEAEEKLANVGIILNRNTIPGDTRGPLTTSGLRIGVPAMVTRGATVTDMAELATLIDNVLRDIDQEATQEAILNFAKRMKLPA